MQYPSPSWPANWLHTGRCRIWRRQWVWCGVSQGQLLRGGEHLARSLGWWLTGICRDRAWRALWAGGETCKLRAGQAPSPCTPLLLTGALLVFCERIWMNSTSSATQKSSPCDWAPRCQQVMAMFQADGWPAPLPLPTSAFRVKSQQRPSHKIPAWPLPGWRGECFLFSLLYSFSYSKHP